LQGNSIAAHGACRDPLVCCLKISGNFNYRFSVRPRARMQLSKAADLPPAPATAAWRSHSVASVLKEFAVVPVAPLEPVAPEVAVELPVLLGGGRGVEVCGAQAGNNSSSNQSALGFMIHPTGVAV
jgi:hypothetical protein